MGVQTLEAQISEYIPQTEVGRSFKSILTDVALSPALRSSLLEAISRIHVVQSELRGVVFRGLDGVPWRHPGDSKWDHRVAADWRARGRSIGGLTLASYHPLLDPRDSRAARLIEDCGLLSQKVVTNAFVNALVAQLAAGTAASSFKYHGLGTGTTVEAAADTALVTELTTEYGNSNTRATGSQVDNSATPHTYTSVGTNTLDSGTPAVTEHGVFSAASAGTLMDRSKFTAINLDGTNGDGLQTTYTLSINAGG